MSLIYPLFIPEEGCPSQCIYCDQHKISGAGDFDLDHARLAVADFVRRNPGKEKQVAFYGGSFTALSQSRIRDIFARIVPLLDPDTSLRISTHPLAIDSEIVRYCAQNRVRVIELGIQSFSDIPLAKSGRGYTGLQAETACRTVLDAGLELGVQLMPGLPGCSALSQEHDLQRLLTLKPQYLRLYPLVIIRGTPLEELYHRGDYLPLSLDEAVSTCADITASVEKSGIKVIKIGLPSGIDEAEIVSGPWHPAFGEFVKAELLIRQISLDYRPEQTIFISKQDRSLLRGHGQKYQSLLCERLRICSERIVYL